MSTRPTEFWNTFNNKAFAAAQKHFDALDEQAKQTVLQELFQKSEYHRKPVMISVLRRELHDNMSFADFYQSWFPSKDMCNKIEVNGQVFQQHFPAPVRVINAVNINNQKEIFSIGLTWVRNPEEEHGMWQYLEKTTNGENENNEVRHQRIKEKAEGELLGLFRVETDDNLGVPF